MKKTLLILTTLLLVTAGLFAEVDKATSEKAYEILEKTNDTLAYHGDYSATISIVVEKPNKPKENLQYKIFQRTDKKLMTMVQIFPEADKGNGYLMDGENIWAYDPISRKFTHTSIKDAIGDSDLKVSDVDNSEEEFRKNYVIEEFKEGTLGKYEVYIITAKAITNEPSYAKTRYYIRKDIPLVLKEEDYSGSDRLMATTLMPKYTKVPAGYVPTQIITRDELNVGENTQMVISDLNFSAIPDRVFTKAYLEGLN